MRLSSAISNNNSGSFLKAHSQMQDSFEPFLNDFNNMKGFFLDLSKHDSFSSTSTSDSGRSSESSREEISFTHKSKHQVTLERRHRNFQIKKKTELCKTYLLGLTCPYGAKCSFAHGTEELRGKLLVPTNYKTINCKQYYELGYCNYGPRCQFIHKACEKLEAPTRSLGYKKIFESMLTSYEKSQFNNEEIIDIHSFLEDKVCLEGFGQRRLEIFESCREEF